MKKTISVVLSVIIMLSAITIATVPVQATASVIENALQWAIGIANDDSHGYSQSSRWGPDYDCSSFVISALKSAGLDVGSATYTGNMRSNLTAHDFTWIPWSEISSSANLQRGDILLNEASHTEFYLGNNQNVGAHSNRGYPQTGDQTGTEVSVSGYYYHPWDGVLRYNGGNITAFGYDYPTDNQTISDKTFVFQGWVTTTKSISSITCSINDGQKYFTASLYTRSDVPGATAFRTEIPTINLNMGNNKVAVCVNYTDGTGDVAGYRTVTRTRPDYTYGYDNPVEGEHINDSTFLFQGWIDADKEIEKITCSINDGERYFEAGLYTRPDVPNAVAFRREIYSDYLNYGENHISVCLTYADGTSVTVARKTIYRTYVAALDNPTDSEFILDDKFLFQGWVESEKEIKNINCLINGETYLNAALYTRPDVPYATAYRLEANRSYLDYGKNTIEVYVEYEDGTNMKLLKRNIYNFEKVDLGTDFEAYIEHIESQKVLSVDNEDNVIIKTNSESDNPIWTFSKNTNGSYTIISKSNNKCLDNYAASGTSKSNVQVYEQNNTNAQQWYVLKGTTSYYLMPVCSNKCCIDLTQNDATDGTNIRLYDFNDTYAQKYNIVKTSFEIGDINGDGNVNITDATEIQKYSTGTITFDDDAINRADVNSDGQVNVTDATIIQKYAVGLIDNF